MSPSDDALDGRTAHNPLAGDPPAIDSPADDQSAGDSPRDPPAGDPALDDPPPAATVTEPRPVHPSAVPTGARRYQGQRAGVVSRFLADGVDLLVVIAIMALISTGIAAVTFLLDPRQFHWPEKLSWSILAIGFVIVVPYLALSWASTGRTYGKALLGLRVVDHRGRRPHMALAWLRAAFCVVVPIGLLWVAINRHNRSVQDVVLRTSVIYDWAPVDARDPARR